MMRWLQLFVLVMSVVSFVIALGVYRMGRRTSTIVWGVRANLVGPLGLIALTAPQVVAPGLTWLRWVGTIASTALLCLSFVFLKRQRVAMHAATQTAHDVR